MFYITYDVSIAAHLQLSDKEDKWIRKDILARTNQCRSWHQAPPMVESEMGIIREVFSVNPEQ